MRYAIFFTPSYGDPLTLAGASWLGRSVYSGEEVEHPDSLGVYHHDIAFQTALPRRYGFHAELKAPFALHADTSEPALLRELMRFAGTVEPFVIESLEVMRFSNHFGLGLRLPCAEIETLAATVVQHFHAYAAPLTEAEIERRNPDHLTAPQFANLHRWGNPHVMEEYRFQMPLTGPVQATHMARIDRALRDYFEPLLHRPVPFTNLALFVEREPGAPFMVHSLHPMGRVSARKIA
ncbi:DUF1045 domain-containing protein [Agrobacterium sp. ES01]|uniref:DUF1045 domain-containing protein n=1 Tax=Agrobacterium sp. ES01 TaxID=3420714 RepID=UPI003D0BC061